MRVSVPTTCPLPLKLKRLQKRGQLLVDLTPRPFLSNLFVLPLNQRGSAKRKSMGKRTSTKTLEQT